MSFDPTYFIALYALVGFLVGIAILSIHGSQIIWQLRILSEADGMDPGQIGAALIVTAMCVVIWPLLISEL